jgi:hypothetical protein
MWGYPVFRVPTEAQMLKRFYDTFTGVATGAVRYGSFVGEGFGLLVSSF